ncbi:MAG: hypothetical protein K9L98_02390 [Candidatus Pacebacteria bacterium]|nr:hypothetical protein [Candidatus Paceibacterota bacterium]MCF7862835.1 hypothetical protein [Candidatus Paceibacterota bacterium]
MKKQIGGVVLSKIKKGKLIFFVVLFFSFVFVTQNVFACSPIQRTAQENIEYADIIFTGELVSNIEPKSEYIENLGEFFGLHTMTFKVEKYWKGKPDEILEVKGVTESCIGFSPKIGAKYLLYAKKDNNLNAYTVSFLNIIEVSSLSDYKVLESLGEAKTFINQKSIIKDDINKKNIKKESDKSIETKDLNNDINIEEYKPSILRRFLLWLLSFTK